MNTNVRDPLERRSREALARNMERLALGPFGGHALSADEESAQLKTQQEENKMIPDIVTAMIKAHPASLVTLNVLRKATGIPVPGLYVGNAQQIMDWLEEMDNVDWAFLNEKTTQNSPRNTTRNTNEFDEDTLYCDGDTFRVDFTGSQEFSINLITTYSSYAPVYGNEVFSVGDLEDEYESIDELVSDIEHFIDNASPELNDPDVDASSIDAEGEIDWDSIYYREVTDVEAACSHSSIRAFAHWLVEQGHIRITSEDE